MNEKTAVTRSKAHRHDWILSDPFNFEGPIFECRCGEKRLEIDGRADAIQSPIPSRQSPAGV